MTLLKRLNNFFSSAKTKKDFIYPYADDTEQKREQIWQNLQKGVLLEDKGILVAWLYPFDGLKVLAEQKRERADRTELHFGKRTILDGYEARLEATRWKFKSGDEFLKQVSENLGQDDEGEQRFQYLRSYLTGLLGEPTRAALQKFGNADIGEITWENGGISLSLIGIEHVNLRYTFHIGIKSANGVY